MTDYIKQIIKLQKEIINLSNLKEENRIKYADVVNKLGIFSSIDKLEEKIKMCEISKTREKTSRNLSLILIAPITFIYFNSFISTINFISGTTVYGLLTILLIYSSKRSNTIYNETIKDENKLKESLKLEYQKMMQNGKSYDDLISEKTQIVKKLNEIDNQIENNYSNIYDIKKEMERFAVNNYIENSINVKTLKEPIKVKRLTK